MFKKIRKTIGAMLAILIVAAGASPQAAKLQSIPDEMYLQQSQSQTLDIGLPFSAEISSDDVDVLSFNGDSLQDQGAIDLAKPVTITGKDQGSANLSVSMFGVKVKNLRVNVGKEKRVIPGGQSIGVTLYTKGALVVGISDIMDEKGEVRSVAKEAGLQSGDIILSVDGKVIKDAFDLTGKINHLDGDSIELGITRNNEKMKIKILPIKDVRDGVYKLGIWVRDSMAGVGTLTFFDPDKKRFASLGHAITDIDTRTLLDIKEGEIMESSILDVKQGSVGDPGEIRGSFDDRGQVLGRIDKNTMFGIFGQTYKDIKNPLYPQGIEIATQSEVKLGAAQILTTVDDRGIQAYDCEIIRMNEQVQPSPKGMVMRISDKKLLETTGGIIQGMSGSPIIQNGKLIGAVTHVFVNDPTRGYCMYIEWMLDEMDK